VIFFWNKKRRKVGDDVGEGKDKEWSKKAMD
jgi:hypothetical protein